MEEGEDHIGVECRTHVVLVDLSGAVASSGSAATVGKAAIAARPVLAARHEVAELRDRLALDGQRGRERGGSSLDHAPCLVGEEPASVGRDRHGKLLVARGVERSCNRDGRDARDVVLGGSPAEEQQHAHSAV